MNKKNKFFRHVIDSFKYILQSEEAGHKQIVAVAVYLYVILEKAHNKKRNHINSCLKMN